MPEQVISIDVECAWCGAKPGEPCSIQDSSPKGYHLSWREGHIIRTKPVPEGSEDEQ